MTNKKETTKQSNLKALLFVNEIIKSGYAGVMPNGNIVDRREHPNAIPLQKNSIFNTPELKPVRGKK